MLNIRRITRREWEETSHDYKGITTILVCRHCGEWAFKWRTDPILAECASTTGHEWTERRQRTLLGRDERGTFLEFVEVVELA